MQACPQNKSETNKENKSATEKLVSELQFQP